MAEDKRLDNGQVQNNPYGSIRVDDEVVAQAAAIAACTLEGVVDTFGTAEGFKLGKRTGVKGVRASYKDGGFSLVLNIKVRAGFSIPDLANELQRRVKAQLEEMTGARVRAVDIFVQDIDFHDTNPMETGEQHA